MGGFESEEDFFYSILWLTESHEVDVEQGWCDEKKEL